MVPYQPAALARFSVERTLLAPRVGVTSGAPRRRAFTLVEALVSMSITAMAGSAVLLGVAGAIDATDLNLEQSMAAGMAQQLMDEIAGKRYMPQAGNPYAVNLGPDGGALAGPGRSQFDDLGDYNGLRTQPPTDGWGVVLGTGDGQGGQRNLDFQTAPGYFSRWHQSVDVYYVSDSNLTQALPFGSTSNHRAVHVQILVDDPVKGPQPRADLTRVFAYVPGS